jgi:hypothetical protein
MRAYKRGRGTCKKYETRLVRNWHEYRLPVNLFSLLRGQWSPPLLRNEYKRNYISIRGATLPPPQAAQ